MRNAVLWGALLATVFCPLAMPEQTQGEELLETRQYPPAQPDAGLIFLWPDGRQSPARLSPGGIVTLPDGSVPRGNITLRLPDGQELPLPPDGRVDLSRILQIQEKTGEQSDTPQLPGGFPPAGTPPQSAPEISLRSLTQEELTILQQGTPLQIHPDGQRTPVTVLPDGSVRMQDGSVIQESIRLLLPDGSVATLEPGEKLDPAQLKPKDTPAPAKPSSESPAEPPATTPQAKTPADEQAAPSAPAAPGKSAPDQSQDMLASLLPSTPIPPSFQGSGGGTPKPQDGKGSAAAPKSPNGGGKPEAATAPSQEKKDSKPKKPKPGEALNIPPEAAKKGDLSFLEGCWQGTRPEYYSKRTIRECFCFDKGGKTGKRRIFDPKGSRQCVGATRANFGGNGVLQVYSEGAYCSDGVRWGAAEMTCRGNGQSTPCSWIFTDANGGRQSYQIPFIRVESCRR